MLKLPSKFLYRVLLCGTFIASSAYYFPGMAMGLSQEFMLSQRWRTLLSTTSPLTNPTFINNKNYMSGRIAYSSILNKFRTAEAGFIYPIDLYQTAGISVYYQGLAEGYQATRLVAGNVEDIQGMTVNETTTFFQASYAYNVLMGLDVGANVNAMVRNFYDMDSKGVGVDLGLSYRLIQHPVIGVHSLGLNVQNAVYVSLGGESDILSRALRVSLVSTYLERQIESAFDFSLRDLGTGADQFKPPFSSKSEWSLDGKVGTWIIRMIKAYALVGMTDAGPSYIGLAGGVNLPSFNNGRDMELLIQYLNGSDVEDQSPTSFISMYLQADIGKHREEVYARRMAKLASAEPNDLYVRGVELYVAGNYWDAFFIFSRLFVEYPDFFKNDWVSFFLGSCQENLDMRLTAEEAFSKTKEKYSRSAAVPFADLGLMRVYYRDGNFGAVENQFNELNKLGVPDSIKYHAYYYMGQTEMKKQNYSKARQLFELIPETHPDYVFAQHTSAISNVLEDNMDGAIYNLENCIQAQVTTAAQKEIVYRSYVFIGYMFYEELTQQEGPLAKAVTAFRMVPKNSKYYVDALLGLAWTALKARQWNDCKNAGQEIQSTTKNAVTKAEGALLEAYTYMIEKNHNQAVTLLDKASKSLAEFQLPSQAELMSKQDENNATRAKYTEIARKAYDLGTSRQSEIVTKQIDSLHTHQKKMKKDIDEFLDFVDIFERGSFFSRNFESVQEDVEYALARAEKLGGQIIQQEKMTEIKDKTKDIDEDLEKLKEQLKKEEERNIKNQDNAPVEEIEEIKEPEPAPEVEPEPTPEAIPEEMEAPAPIPEEDMPMDDPFEDDSVLE